MPKAFIEKTRKKFKGKAPAPQQKLLDIWAENFHAEDIVKFDSNVFSDMIEMQWKLTKNRKDGHSRFAIYSPVAAGQALRKTVIDVVSSDMAFLVDSVAAEINKNGYLIDLLLHPVFYAKYDGSGKMTDISATEKKGYVRQSHMHIHINKTLSEDAFEALEKGLNIALADVYIANRDWAEMLRNLKNARDELGAAKTKLPARVVQEYCAFLDYLHNNNFTLLGYREYAFSERNGTTVSRIVPGKSLGLLSDDIKPVYISEAEESLPRHLQEFRRNLPAVSVSKTNRLATVHRRVPMDAVAIKIYDKAGKVVGEKLFLGLFTSVTYSRSVGDVPYLREKVETVMHMSNFLPGSHDRKALRHILEKYPRDELFQIPEKELFNVATQILRLQERQRIALFMRQDFFGRYISCLVYVPRDRFGTSLRKRITQILEEELQGVCSNFYTSMDEAVFARAMFVINISQKNPPSYNPAAIEARLQEAGLTVPERLSMALAENVSDEQEITRLTLKYGEAFPVSYTTHYRAKQSLFDIYKIEEALAHRYLALDLYRPENLPPEELRLKIYSLEQPITLSDVLPILENMGLRVLAELPFEVRPAGENIVVWIHDFHLMTVKGAREDSIDIDVVKENFESAFRNIWYRKIDNDGLNKLLLNSGMKAEEITVLRAYTQYLRQIRSPYSQSYIHAALTQNPKISRLLFNLFDAYLNPKASVRKAGLVESLAASIERALEAVESLDQDRILRSILNLVEVTLRTNFYQLDEDGQHKTYLSLKFDSRSVNDLPEPKPLCEIFVYSPRVEAIHLRGDKVARGGLRWSDRHEDYRTEVLGLMKAQMVKNAVIVPMGSKGGFVVKTPTRDREQYRAEGIECYKIFMNGLLDITDNLRGEKVLPPPLVVRRDGDDPYLVVAADKGTATFSDIANERSLSYKFWLGDAYASGGSAGYDHKKMGITARGVWESVKLHFRQFNHNTQTQPFDVVGVGDMGGDVFGNGMLMSDQIRLIGAFNHAHIFCDPSPDPAVSFKERQRLFKAVQGWDHYDLKKLSKGGRIYSRNDKILTLTPEIMKRFDFGKDKVSPGELIQVILKARTDLLWFGGIGTYVKGSGETHMDVGDKTNDAVRIDAQQIRAKVIGEGANLAVTQRGRIEFAEKGGKLNTDFIDNSGGVDSSDHEVNIKILFADVLSQPKAKLDIKGRNKVLESMTDEVAQHVLRNNYQQAQAISLAEMQAKDTLKLQAELIEDLEREGALNRALEGLPDAEEIDVRLRLGKGMTRPELCILLAYSKIAFTRHLLESDIPDSPIMQNWLYSYFPEILQKKFPKEIERHRLRREIIAMSMANSMINRLGPTAIKAISKKTGANAANIARAYVAVREIFKLRDLWRDIEALDNLVPAEVQLRAMRDIAQTAEQGIVWFLSRLGRDIKIPGDIEDYASGIETYKKTMKTMLSAELEAGLRQRGDILKSEGIPEALAKAIAAVPMLVSGCDIIRIALKEKAKLQQTGQAYFAVGRHFHLDWLRQQGRYMTAENHWQAEAIAGVIDQLYGCQAGLTVTILREDKEKAGAFESWLKRASSRLKQIDPFFATIRASGVSDLAVLTIAEQKLRGLYA